MPPPELQTLQLVFVEPAAPGSFGSNSEPYGVVGVPFQTPPAPPWLPALNAFAPPVSVGSPVD